MTLKERSAEGMCPHPNLSRTSARWSRRSAILLAAITAVSAAFAQGKSEEARRERPAPTQISLDPDNPEYQITENGPHHRKWERVEKRVNEEGEEEEIVHRYTELGTGLNRWDTEKEEWLESNNVIEAFEGGAVAQGGQTKVIFSPILGDAAGTVDILTADGKRIRTVVIGLAYYDPVSGEDILLSEVNPDVEGEIIPPNRVIYRNAFTDIKADVIYEYHRDRFSQNVVIYEAFESPGALGLSELARLEVLSEILESPRPQIKERVLEAFSTDPVQRGKMAEADLVDESLFFGESFMGQGIAFELGGTIETRSVVTKRLIEEGGRRILIEGVGYTDAKGYLDKLPRTIVKPRKSRASTDGVGPSRSREIPQRRLAQGTRAEDSPLRMAALDTAPQSGFLIDYELVSGSLNDYRFETGTTYFLDNTTVQLAGDTIFEGGAVIKMLNSYMILNDLAAFQTSAYQPLLVTSRDDDTVGETIAGSNGQPSVDDSIAFLMQPLSGQLIEHVRIKYSYIGIYSSNPSNLTIRDFQITDCFYPAAFFSGSGVSFENGLITDSFMLTCGASNTKGINLTLHDLDEFYISSNELTNCLLVDVDIIHPYGRQGSADNVELSSSSGVFQTAGGGHYYVSVFPTPSFARTDSGGNSWDGSYRQSHFKTTAAYSSRDQ